MNARITTCLRRCVSAALAGFIVAAAMPAQAAPAPVAAASAPALRERCLSCHDDAQLKSDAGVSLAVLADDYARSAHRRIDCAACHDAALTVRHPRQSLGAVRPQVCRDCHGDEFQAVAAGVHGRRAAGERAVRDCAACHGNLHAPRDPAGGRPLSAVNQIRTCGACHEDVVRDYERSEHARGLLKSGLIGRSPSCSGCHGTHDVRGRSDPASVTHHSKIGQTCGNCHQRILEEWQDSAHAALLRAGKPGPDCASCHEPHAIRRPDGARERSAVAGRCGSCHERVGRSFQDSFHGKASALAHERSAVCADCHTAHRNLGKHNPASSIHPDRLAATCGACHAKVNAAFLSFDPHADPRDASRNRWVHWIWLGMTALLLGVFGFFGLHGLLWLQRALVGRLRGEFAPIDRHGTHVLRFSGMQIAVHVAIVVSFLLLAATGLPLKFAHAPWAAPLMSAFGGAQVAGWLHRAAAVVTFGYFAWHLGMVLHARFVRGRRGMLWGPNSMMPQPRDIVDLWRMFKWFVYLGARPRFDHFTYWEKFDYLAVFWGVAIIGISGLVLWFPAAATVILPGWALNAAYVIHSDEALLATGFIFMFHFLHTHLRPEVFPMDTVIFTGRMPLAAFEHERAEEYERLAATGRLEERLVSAPSPAALRAARIIGTLALLAGVALAVLIFWALWGELTR